MKQYRTKNAVQVEQPQALGQARDPFTEPAPQSLQAGITIPGARHSSKAAPLSAPVPITNTALMLWVPTVKEQRLSFPHPYLGLQLRPL